MNELLPTVLIAAALLAGGAAIVLGTIALERLVKFEYQHNPERWRADGRPRVSIWQPQAPSSYSAGWAFTCRLFFSTPAWAAADSSCRRWLSAFRLSSILGIAAVASILAYIRLA